MIGIHMDGLKKIRYVTISVLEINGRPPLTNTVLAYDMVQEKLQN